MKNFQYPFLNPEVDLDERIRDLLSRLTLNEKVGMLTNKQRAVERLGIKEWHIGTEVARGLIKYSEKLPTTVFPQPLGMAAMFDPDLMYKIGEAAGNEARIYNQQDPIGTLMLWGPTVDMERDPRWGRTEEAYGEDPYLTGEMSSAYTLGLRGNDPFYLKTLPALKHFYANNNEFERFKCNANITTRLKREYYLKAFEPAVRRGGAYSMMSAYNQINGVEGIVNPEIRDIAKAEWGLWFVVGDGGDFKHNVVEHKTYQDHAEAYAKTIKNGADIMNDEADLVAEAALEALKRGLLTEADIDRALGNCFRGRFRLGEFDPKERNPYANIDEKLLCCEAYRQLTEEAARKQVILLKNDGLLPLKKEKINKLAVIGPLSNENYRDWYAGLSPKLISVLDGLKHKIGEDKIIFEEGFDQVAFKSKKNGQYLCVKEDASVAAISEGIHKNECFEMTDWDFNSITFRSMATGKYLSKSNGIKCDADAVWGWFVGQLFGLYPQEANVILQTWDDLEVQLDGEKGLKTCYKSRVTADKLFEIETVSSGIERAVEAAKNADVAVVFVGNHPLLNGRECEDRPELTLPQYQQKLIKEVFAANPNTIVVMVSSYPYTIQWEKEHIPSIIFSSHAGPELGTAIADTLFGDCNPAGRTPLTWYKSARELPSIMDYDIMKNGTTYLYYEGEPLYCFGHGLSYSTFQYDHLGLEKKSYETNEKINLSVDITNTSCVDGEEVVQLYVKPVRSMVKRPLKQLKAFKRVTVKAGQTVSVKLSVDVSEINFWDVNQNKFCVEKGDYELMVGASSEDIRAEHTIFIHGEDISGKNVGKLYQAIDIDDYHKVTFESTPNMQSYIYAKGAWQSFAQYTNVQLDNYTGFEVFASNVGTAAQLTLINEKTSEVMGVCEIPPTGSFHHFIGCSCEVKPFKGICNLGFRFSGDLGIMNFRFVKN